MENLIRTFQENEVIFREGVYERCMYEIVGGSVKVCVNYGTEEETLLTVLEKGQFLGEIGITEVLPRTATAVAAEKDTQLAEITTESFGDYFHKEPRKLLAVMRHMSSRLRKLTEDYLAAREAVAEAMQAEKKGLVKSDGLAARLAVLVQNAGVPSFLRPGKPFEEAEFLNAGADQARIFKTFGKHEIIFREGDESGCLYDICWGGVGIYAHYGQANQTLLARLNPEQYFGEMGVLENAPRSATAVAMESGTKVELITEATFGRFLEEKPYKVMTIMMHLSSRLRALTAEYLEICRLAEKAAKREKEQKNAWTEVLAEAFVAAFSNPTDPWDAYLRYRK